MSFAIYAAPFENNNNKNYKLIEEDENIINKKRVAKNKTQKKRNLDENINPKVLSAMQQIHNSIKSEDNDEEMNDFTPPPPSISAGMERIDMREDNLENTETISENQYNASYQNQYLSNTLVTNENIDDTAYKNYISNPNLGQNNSSGEILDRMNYMIHLLEDQQGRKTNNVTEEIVLYSFLGIFTIFIVDSFARVGKYVR